MERFNFWAGWSLVVLYVLIVVSAIIVVLSENKNPIRSLAWVIALIFLPGIGLIFYLFFGRSPKTTIISRRYRRKILSVSKPTKPDHNAFPLTSEQRQLVKLASGLESTHVSFNNSVEIFTTGEEKFRALFADLRKARHYILLQYYIFSDDELGRRMADLLIEKAREGVSVKVIYDHVGSFSTKSSFFKRMRREGVDVHPFFRVSFPKLASRINWRNHRKIVVIDGEVGYIGGMNIAMRYAAGSEKGPAWRDTHLRVKGDIVNSLGVSFALDWNLMNQPLDLTPRHAAQKNHGEVGLQIVTSGPIETRHNLSLCFLKAILSARKSVYIQTPYFLPTEALLAALQTAAIGNVDVRIMMPRVPDSRMIRYASYSYITQCLEAGIKVYFYEPGMIHSKLLIIDDNLVSTGSTNFDFRSLENNFEANLLIYSEDVNRRMRDIFFADLQNCSRLKLSEWRKRPYLQRVLESMVRLVSPVL